MGRVPQSPGVVAVLAVMLIATGCVPTSTHGGADLSHLDAFKIEKNKTTEKELIDHFGPPGNTTTRGDGTQMLSWNDDRQSSDINMSKAIPIVGLFTGPAVDQKIAHRSLTATVRDGVVIDYTATDGNEHKTF
jgi:hypothetical protein